MTSVQTIATAFQEGGWGMMLILALLVAGVVLVVERSLVLLRASRCAPGIMAELGRLLRARDVTGAAALCGRVDTPLTRIVGAGLARGFVAEERFRAAMGEAARRELPGLEKRTGYLALLGNVATLAGLLGTIVGLIHSFRGVSTSTGESRAALLARGISEAMNCTAFGLLVGVGALLAYSLLNGRTQRLLDEINRGSMTVFRLWRAAVSGGLEGRRRRQPIVAPGPRLLTYAGVKRQKQPGRKKALLAGLQLTPMIDMFIVVLIFLLMNFSSEYLFVTRDVKLPFAERVDKLERAPVVSVSHPESDPAGGVVTLDGREIATAREVGEAEGADWAVEPLTRQLESIKHGWKLTHPATPFPGEVIVQADRSVDFKIVKKLIYSCGLAGYSNVHFAVSGGGS